MPDEACQLVRGPGKFASTSPCTKHNRHRAAMLACVVGRAARARVSPTVPAARFSCVPRLSCTTLTARSAAGAGRPAGLLRATAGHPGLCDPRRQDDRRATAQQSASYASYSGRGKPTRTRVRQEPTEQEEAARYSEMAKRHDESVAGRPSESAAGRPSETAATTRQADSLHDAGLKNFMVNIYTTTGGCIGMAAVGSVLPILGVVPMVHPIVPLIPFFVSEDTHQPDQPDQRSAYYLVPNTHTC